MHTSRVASAAVLPVCAFLCLALVAMSAAAGSEPSASGAKTAGAKRQSPPANAVADFGPSQNPSGAWSYGQRAAKGLNSTFTPYPTNANVFGPGLESWSASANCCPSVTRNATGGTVVYQSAPSVSHPADVLNLHPGAAGQRSAVRWTAPSAGVVTIQGRFEGIDAGNAQHPGTTTDFAILGSATAAQPATLYRGTVQGHQNVTRFSVARAVAAGEVVEFSVGFGLQAANDPPPTANHDSTGLAVNITYGTPSPDTTGQWGPLLDWNTSQMAQINYPAGPGFQPPVAIHGNLLPDGNVLFWARDSASDGGADLLDSTPGARVWQPGTLASEPGVIDPSDRGTFTITGLPTTNLFCAGHAFLPDGRLLTAGGHHGADGYGEVHTNLFDWRNNTWTRGPDMGPLHQMGRWYPTVITLANGDAVIVSGTYRDTSGSSPVTRDNHVPQVWNTSGATGTLRNLTAKPIPALPRIHLAPDGRVYISGPQRGTYLLDTAGAGTWTDAPNSPGTSDRWNGSSVMYDVGKVLIMGGGQDNADPQKRPLDSAATIDLNVSPLAWQPANPMSYRREFINATILADGQVLVTGGSSGRDNNEQQAAMAAELWNPETGQWTTMATMLSYRGYHTTALLLPDGKVLVAGSGQPPFINPPGTNAQIFSPPYLFRGPRPVIKSAPASVNYNQTFFVETDDAASVSKVTLVRLGSVTHSFDANQRFNRLTFTVGTGGLNVNAPASANACPPGHYMLFVLDGDGVPSVSKIIKVDPNTPAPPGAPAALVSTADASLAVNVTWAASSGNVSHYEVHRGPTRTGPFARIAANVSGLAFTDSNAPPGTAHVYRVRAVDPLGNFSAFGNSDFATTVLFTDNPLAPGATIKAEHLAQLRQAVNAVRAAAGLSQVGWTEAASPGTSVRAVHVQELRAGIEPALAQFGLAFGQYTDPTLTPGVTPIRAAHWQELRDRVK
jgi:Domain of unknown function (DUF1929)